MKSRKGVTALLLIGVALAVPSLARAGGDFVDLAATGSHVWFVGEPGVRELDAQTGRTLARPKLLGAAYPLSVTLAGGGSLGRERRERLRLGHTHAHRHLD